METGPVRWPAALSGRLYLTSLWTADAAVPNTHNGSHGNTSQVTWAHTEPPRTRIARGGVSLERWRECENRGGKSWRERGKKERTMGHKYPETVARRGQTHPLHLDVSLYTCVCFPQVYCFYGFWGIHLNMFTSCFHVFIVNLWNIGFFIVFFKCVLFYNILLTCF